MGNELRAVSHTMADDAAIQQSDQMRFRALMKDEKNRIIKRDLATWVDTPAPLGWTEKKAVLWDRSMGRCHYCQKVMNPFSEFSVDHVVPRSKGGPDDLSNLVACCRGCNTDKRDRDVSQWRLIVINRSLRVVK